MVYSVLLLGEALYQTSSGKVCLLCFKFLTDAPHLTEVTVIKQVYSNGMNELFKLVWVT